MDPATKDQFIQALQQNLLEKEMLINMWIGQLSEKDELIRQLKSDIEILKALSKESEDVWNYTNQCEKG
jgi:hypothetical protein